MKKKNSRFFRHFAILFAAVFAVHFFPVVSVPVKAAGIEISLPGVVGGTLTFDESTGTIVDCSENVTSVEIPSEINGIKVTAIGKDAFSYCSHLKKLTIPEGITTIEDHAFGCCTALTNIHLLPV